MTPDLEMAERRVGTTFREKWTLEKLLGVGGMAAVYVARHKIGRLSAIKILHPEIADSPDLAARFEQEAHAVNRFKHPGAVEILDVDFSDRREPFLVMELLEGESLEDRMEKGPVPIGDLLEVIDDLLDVLVAAHAAGIIHRDIKPENLFLLKSGGLKVLDFGIARVSTEAGASKLKTAMGVTLGTLSYMPPEQVAGAEIDARSDIFAVGCTMFQAISGRTPHEAATDLELMIKAAMQPAPSLASVAPSVPSDVCRVVDRALAFEKADRYPDAASMQRDVRALRQGQSLMKPLPALPAAQEREPSTVLVMPPDTKPPEVPEPRESRVAVFLVAGVFMLAGVLVAVWWSTRAPARPAEEPPAPIASAPPPPPLTAAPSATPVVPVPDPQPVAPAVVIPPVAPPTPVQLAKPKPPAPPSKHPKKGH